MILSRQFDEAEKRTQIYLKAFEYGYQNILTKNDNPMKKKSSTVFLIVLITLMLTGILSGLFMATFKDSYAKKDHLGLNFDNITILKVAYFCFDHYCFELCY